MLINHNSTGNVVTLYDGIGIKSESSVNSFSAGTYNFNMSYDFTPMNIKLEVVQNQMENEYYQLRALLFDDLKLLFPRYTTEATFTRRPVFYYLHEFDRIKAFKVYVQDLKSKYKKVVKLYRKKAVTIDDFKEVSDLMIEASNNLFESQSNIDVWYYPDEKRFKKKLALLRGVVEKKRRAALIQAINDKEDRMCSMIEFLDREESIALEKIKISLKNNESKLSFGIGNLAF